MFSSKVDPAFASEEFLRILQCLVGGEDSNSAQAERIQVPLLHLHSCAESPDQPAVDLLQVPQNQLFDVFITGTTEDQQAGCPQSDSLGNCGWGSSSTGKIGR